jgi:hypothetical protein
MPTAASPPPPILRRNRKRRAGMKELVCPIWHDGIVEPLIDFEVLPKT